MPLFPRFVPQSNTSGVSYSDIRPLLEAVLQDPSYYNQSPSHASCHKPRQTGSEPSSKRAFSPSFDVRETEHAYVLEGELPGLSDKNTVEIEFTDHQTLLVKGRIERSFHNTNATTADSASNPQEPATGKGKDKANVPSSPVARPHTPPHPTVEDDIDEDDKASTIVKTPQSSPAVSAAKLDSGKKEVKHQQPQQPKIRYWIAERQIGEFQRSFSFPGLIDQDKVSAKLANGILTIVVPKKTAHVTKKVYIQ